MPIGTVNGQPLVILGHGDIGFNYDVRGDSGVFQIAEIADSSYETGDEISPEDGQRLQQNPLHPLYFQFDKIAAIDVMIGALEDLRTLMAQGEPLEPRPVTLIVVNGLGFLWNSPTIGYEEVAHLAATPVDTITYRHAADDRSGELLPGERIGITLRTVFNAVATGSA